MKERRRNIAIIGANKEALKLLPILVRDRTSRVKIIADSNPDAMIFKLRELGYKLSDRLGIRTTNDLEELKREPDIDVIIDAVQDAATEKFLEDPAFRDVEKLGPLSAKLVWQVRCSAAGKGGSLEEGAEGAALFTSLKEIVDSLRLITNRKEILSVLLKLVTESTGAERSSIMLKVPGEKTLMVEIAKGMDEEVVRKIRVPFGEGVSGRVAEEGKPLLISGRASPERFRNPRERTDVKSAMCVPLIAEGRVIGVINVSSSEGPDVYTESDLRFLTSLAGIAAALINKSNEYERLRSDAAKFEFWKEIDDIMSSDMPIERRLSIIAQKVVGEVPGLTCYIYLYNEESKRLLLKASSSRDAASLGMLGIKPGEGIEGYAMETRKDVFLVDRTEEDEEKKVYFTLPMVCQNRFVGTLSGQVVSPEGLSRYHESFLKDVRTLVAQSVYRYMESERDSRWKRRFSEVDDMGLELITLTNPRKLVNMIAEKAAAAIGADGALLRIMQDDTQKYQTAATWGLEDAEIRQQFQPLEKETVLEVLRKKEPIMREFSEKLSPAIRAVLSYPLKIDDKIIGVLTLFNKAYEGSSLRGAFTHADLEIIKRFALFAEKAVFTTLFRDKVITEPKAKDIEDLRPVESFEKIVEKELNRSRRLDKNLVVATIRLAGLKDLPPRRREEVDRRFMELVRSRIRNFDTLTKLNDEMYGLVFPDADEKVARVLDTIVQVIKGDALLGRVFLEGPVSIYFGHACFPEDGDSFTSLFSKASRRTMVSPEDPGSLNK